ncbi:Rv1355c family protein [Daejeonella sp.]|uniref:Rv1355c family protein n=1 Tax=Daejeonella sp. TaxID=2805397 RepID=UPI002717430D|nr:Rv1355c family protein [Daejeonella sp.]MDO8993606.1 Rv1355c family protein [Daejeonella sp.]MDP2413911.1 Rv1355c family protein [Daejeonella sp.]
MNTRLSELIKASGQMQLVYKPVFLRITDPLEKIALDQLIENQVSFFHDEIYGQLQELVKMKNPAVRIKPEEYPELIQKHLGGRDIHSYGVWVYYPWSRRLVHMLDEEEFIRVRSNRNQYKITLKEQEILSTKRIGIIGLSVGQSIALTLAMERGFGELRLTDFDTLELSNLNRIRSGVHNLGIPKVVITAREIAEMDPFLKVICFFNGLNEENMDSFFSDNGKLDLLVDECDGLDIKILARFKARELRIPVIMDTSDRGMLDVERFDLEPNRPLLHGTIENVDPQNIKNLSTEDKIPVMLQMLGVENISLRAKASMIEVEQTINTWPQLASSVALGGAVGADVSRRILLDQYHDSGRYYIDLEELIADKEKHSDDKPVTRLNPFKPLTVEELEKIASRVLLPLMPDDIYPDKESISSIVAAATAAPSTGNDQPWKWYYRKGTLFLFHDEFRSHSFGDFQKTASFITFGAAYENLYVHALSLGIEPYYSFFPDESSEKLVATIRFRKLNPNSLSDLLKPLDQAIFKRHTNRIIAPKGEISVDIYTRLATLAESIPGAKVRFFTDENDMRSMARIIGACDRMRLLHPEGHYDFVHREMRWTPEDAEKTLTGIDIRTLELGNSLMAAMGVIKSEKVIDAVKQFGGGNALGMLAMRTVSTASALCMISIPGYDLKNFFEGGRSMERFWLEATNLNLAIHPVISPLYLFSRILHGEGEGLDEKNIKELQYLREAFNKIAGTGNNDAEVFLTKIAIAKEPVLKAHRLPVKDILSFDE